MALGLRVMALNCKVASPHMASGSLWHATPHPSLYALTSWQVPSTIVYQNKGNKCKKINKTLSHNNPGNITLLPRALWPVNVIPDTNSITKIIVEMGIGEQSGTPQNQRYILIYTQKSDARSRSFTSPNNDCTHRAWLSDCRLALEERWSLKTDLLHCMWR